jgi:hypothetical protein
MTRFLRTRRALVALVLVPVAAAAFAAPARAGGWAVTTLDPLPSAPAAGVPVVVGFTIRQHGRTPVALDDVGIDVTDARAA